MSIKNKNFIPRPYGHNLASLIMVERPKSKLKGGWV
jgi:hypothetical protein